MDPFASVIACSSDNSTEDPDHRDEASNTDLSQETSEAKTESDSSDASEVDIYSTLVQQAQEGIKDLVSRILRDSANPDEDAKLLEAASLVKSQYQKRGYDGNNLERVLETLDREVTSEGLSTEGALTKKFNSLQDYLWPVSSPESNPVSELGAVEQSTEPDSEVNIVSPSSPESKPVS